MLINIALNYFFFDFWKHGSITNKIRRWKSTDVLQNITPKEKIRILSADFILLISAVVTRRISWFHDFSSLPKFWFLNVMCFRKTPGRRYIAGSLAALTATCFTYPLDTAKARLSTSTKAEYSGLRDIFVKEYRRHGITIFYRGMYPTLLGVIPYAGSSFFTYETCKLFYTGKDLKNFKRWLRESVCHVNPYFSSISFFRKNGFRH